MTKILLSDFKDYDFNTIHNFLISNSGLEFQIIIPRWNKPKLVMDILTLWEYQSALLIGQKLAEISTKFSYMVPCVSTMEEFLFNCTIPDLDKLCTTLDYILRGIEQSDDDVSVAKFMNEAEKLASNTTDFQNISCLGIFSICTKYLNKKY